VASVQHHDIEAVTCREHLGQHLFGVDRLKRQFVLGLDVGVHRQQVAGAIHLCTLARIVELPYRVRFP